MNSNDNPIALVPGGTVNRGAMIAICIAVVFSAACDRKAESRGRSRSDQYRVLETADPGDEVAADQATLAQLKKAGGDLSKPTHVIHYVYFSDRRRAEAARGALCAAYAGSVDESEGGDRFRLVVEHTTVPSIENITGARQELEKLASANGGTYDGWEAAVTR